MASTMNHHQKSHDDPSADEDDSVNRASLRYVTLQTTTSSSTTATASKFPSLTRTNLHEKRSDQTTTTSTSSNSIQHMISLRDIHQQEDNLFVGSMELHQKHSREKYAANPDELPEVWAGTTSTDAAVSIAAEGTGAAVEEIVAANESDGATGGVEEVSRVNPAPTPANSDSFGDTFDATSQQQEYTGNDEVQMVNAAPQQETTPCHLPSIEGAIQKLTSFGSHSSKNPGIVLRYQYELVQDLTGIDWTINAEGERDGTDYLVENVLPEVEQSIVGETLVPALFEECRKRGLRRLMNSGVVGIDMKPDDFPLPQTDCISDYVPQDPLKSIQCHRVEGAMTLYFSQSSPYTALLPSVTLQALNAIKDDMDNGALLSSHESVLDLKLLDSSYSLESIVPEARPDSGVANKSSSGGNGGLAAGLVVFFLFLGIGAFFGWRKYKSMLFGEELDREGDHEVDIHDVSDLKASISEDDDDDEDASYTSNDSESTGGDGTATDDDTNEGASYSEESTDSDGIFEDDDSFDPEDINSPGYNVYKKRKQTKKAKNNIVIGGMVDEASIATGATGATGLHSVASQKTVQVKNIVLPNALDVDINMR